MIELPLRGDIEYDFVTSLHAWRVHPAKLTSPSARKRQGLSVAGGIAWQLAAPVSLLRASLADKIDLTIQDMIRLLRLEGCDIPSPPRKGACLYSLLRKVFSDWTAEQIHAHWESMINAPTAQQKSEEDIDEDVIECLQNHMTPDQLRDFSGYADALKELEKAERMKRKRPRTDEDRAVTVFDWGPLHVWKRPPTTVRAPRGGWSVRCGPHHRDKDPAAGIPKEIVCSRECNLRSADDEHNVLRRLKMWALGYCCCDTKAKHNTYMKVYPADKDLFTNEAFKT